MSRATAVRSGATESSRSRMRASAGEDSPLASLRSLSPGTNSMERRIMAGSSVLDEGAAALGQRAEGALGADFGDEVVIVPWVVGLGWRFHLEEVDRVDEAAVDADARARGVEVVERVGLHPGHDGGRVLRAGGDDGAEVVVDGRIGFGVFAGRHA